MAAEKGIALSTIGITVHYAIETTPGTRPTTGYKKLPGFKSTPEIGSEPEQLETTTLENLRFKSYTDGLQDIGGALGLVANLNNAFKKAWKDFVAESRAAEEAGKGTWVCIHFNDKLDEDLFIPCRPTPLGGPALETNSVLEITVYITVTDEPDWFEPPTFADAENEVQTMSARQSAKKTTEIDV